MDNLSRWDHNLIFDLIPPKANVLDLGCGNGELLARLLKEKKVTGQGVEADPEQVALAVTAGVPVYQGDLDLGLEEFKGNSFDYVILEKTLQTLRRPMLILSEVLRVGHLCIVSFPNFSNDKIIKSLVETKRMPLTPTLPYSWHETPNIHLCTLYDFLDWAKEHHVDIVEGYTWADYHLRRLILPGDSTLAEELLFVLKPSKRDYYV